MFTFHYLVDQPILDAAAQPALGGNVNGPSLIEVPPWVVNPLGRFYLYFAHHEGDSIRLATADELTGPWNVYAPGALHLKDSGFVQSAPDPAQMQPSVLAMIKQGIDGDYPHIASPDIHIDSDRRLLHMYYHGRLTDGTQMTRLATSTDGIHFQTKPALLGRSYFRVFRYRDYVYALALGGMLYRSSDGITSFNPGHRVTTDNYRHGAILQFDNQIYVVWSRAEDCPECLLVSLLDTRGEWNEWKLTGTTELHRPQRGWEGVNEPLIPSRYGGIMQRVHQLRDPGIFQHQDKIYLLYTVAGEQGVAIAELRTQS